MGVVDGGPAFPCHPGIENPKFDGMTLRDYFAARAMQGMITEWLGDDDFTEWSMAKIAYEVADAMLKTQKA
jgi:hypothetical protein